MIENWVVLLAAGYIGAVIGSFLNVVIFRFISKEPIGLSRSHCPDCQHTLAWYDLVPVFSYLLLGARCRYCKAYISPQYPIVELISLLAAIYITTLYPGQLIVACVVFAIFSILFALFIIDLRTFILPDFLIVLLAVIVSVHHTIAVAPSAMSQYGGVIIGSGFLLMLWLITKGAGIGFGDVKLLIPIGLLFGTMGVVSLLFGAFMVGGLVGGVLLALKKATPKTAIPFGPFLAGMAMLLLLFPGVAVSFWQILFGI